MVQELKNGKMAASGWMNIVWVAVVCWPVFPRINTDHNCLYKTTPAEMIIDHHSSIVLHCNSLLILRVKRRVKFLHARWNAKVCRDGPAQDDCRLASRQLARVGGGSSHMMHSRVGWQFSVSRVMHKRIKKVIFRVLGNPSPMQNCLRESVTKEFKMPEKIMTRLLQQHWSLLLTGRQKGQRWWQVNKRSTPIDVEKKIIFRWQGGLAVFVSFSGMQPWSL